MKADVFDLSRSPLPLPPAFWNVKYSGRNYPGSPSASGLVGGANCQQYAYCVLRHFGFEIPDFRSSELWDDQAFTSVAASMEQFNLVLLNNIRDSYGAHVGLCVDRHLVLHLSRALGAPAIETLEQLQSRQAYQHLIGFKKVARRPIASSDQTETIAKTAS